MLGMSPAARVDAGAGAARVSTCGGARLRGFCCTWFQLCQKAHLQAGRRSSDSQNKTASSLGKSTSCG